MKAFLEKHVRALELRKKGWSYSAIKRELGIAKSTASAWLNKYPLSHEQLDKLQFHNEHRIEAFRATMAKKKEKLFDETVGDQGKIIGQLTEKELYLCGLVSKETTLKGLTYKTRGHGTCNVIANGLKYARPVFAGMEFLARKY